MIGPEPTSGGLDRLTDLITRVEQVTGPGSACAFALRDRYGSVHAIDADGLIRDAARIAALGDAVAAECDEQQAIAADWDGWWCGPAGDSAATDMAGQLWQGARQIDTIGQAATVVDRCGRDVVEQLADLRARMDRMDLSTSHVGDVRLIDEALAVAQGASPGSAEVRQLIGLGNADADADARARAQLWVESIALPAVVEAADTALGWCEAAAAEIRRVLEVATSALEAAGAHGSVATGTDSRSTGDAVTTIAPTHDAPTTTAPIDETRGSTVAPTAAPTPATTIDTGPRNTSPPTSENASAAPTGVAASGGDSSAADSQNDRSSGDGGGTPEAEIDSSPGDIAAAGSESGGEDVAALVEAGIGLGVAVLDFATAAVDAGTAVLAAVTDAVGDATSDHAAALSDSVQPDSVQTAGASSGVAPSDSAVPAETPAPAVSEIPAPSVTEIPDGCAESGSNESSSEPASEQTGDQSAAEQSGGQPAPITVPGGGRQSAEDPPPSLPDSSAPLPDSPPPAPDAGAEGDTDAETGSGAAATDPPVGPERGELAHAGPLPTGQ